MFKNKSELFPLMESPLYGECVREILLNEKDIGVVLSNLSYLSPVRIVFKEAIKLKGFRKKLPSKEYIFYGDIVYYKGGFYTISPGIYYSVKKNGRRLYPLPFEKIEYFECIIKGGI